MHPPPVDTTHCPSCGHTYAGKYCPQCGEKKLVQRELTIRHFIGKVWNALTFTDVKFIRTVGILLWRPGKLTAEFFAGRRKLYTAPLALFFFINLVYFIYQPVDALNSSLRSQTQGQGYSGWAEARVKKQLENTGRSIDEFEPLYNQMSAQVSKLFLIVFVFLFALWLALIHVFKKKLFFFHLIAATHYVSAIILILLIILPLLLTLGLFVSRLFGGSGAVHIDANAWYVNTPLLLVLISYAYGMQRKLYYRAWYVAVPMALLVVVGFVLSVLAYRLFLFVSTMLMLS